MKVTDTNGWNRGDEKYWALTTELKASTCLEANLSVPKHGPRISHGKVVYGMHSTNMVLQKKSECNCYEERKALQRLRVAIDFPPSSTEGVGWCLSSSTRSFAEPLRMENKLIRQ
nr:hypothetical protein Iba_chr12fCG8350 [Ipomoea batatas]